MKAHYSPEQKQQVLDYRANGLSVKDISEKTGVGEQTIRNWVAGGKKTNGGADLKKRAKKTKDPERSIQQQLEDTEFTVHLRMLEINALRKMVKSPDDEVTRLKIENEYLRERCKMLGDPEDRLLIEAPPAGPAHE